jgi:hypothetical protein
VGVEAHEHGGKADELCMIATSSGIWVICTRVASW